MIKKIFFVVFFWGCLFGFSGAKAEVKKEEILFYGIGATLNKDSSLDMQETIKVRALGKKIKKGIYRDFPLKHAGGKTPVSILSVTRNGKNIPYTTQVQNGKKRIYLGDMNKYILSGIYEYKITYKYHNIIRQNDEKTKDELYHNLIGDEWDFDILSVEAIVRLPEGLDLIGKPEVFTGIYGTKKQNSNVERKGNQIFISLPDGVKTGEAMTLRVVSASGFFQIPEGGLFLDKRLNWLFKFAVIMLFVLLAFYSYSSWKKHGKDGDKRPVYPRFDAPKFNSLGALYLLWRYHHVDLDSLNLVMPHLAYLSQRGLLNVKALENEILFEKNKNIIPENSDEKFFLEMAKENYTLKKGKYNASFFRYITAYKKHSESEIDSLYKKNTAQYIMFSFLMFWCCVGSFLLYFETFSNFAPAVVLGLGVFAISNIVLMLFKRERGWILKLFKSIFNIAFIVFWCLGFFGAMFNELFDLGLDNPFSPMLDFKVLFYVLIFACFIAFYKYIIIRVYDKGLFLVEHLEGIKMFLNGADDLKYKAPQQAEMDKLLPYAVLLGMQNQWVEKMKSYFNFEASSDDVFRNAVVFSTVSSSIHSLSTGSSSGGSRGSNGFSDGGCSGGGSGGGGGGGF